MNTMKTKNEIEKELENVDYHLQTDFWEDWRVHLWEGYRDALGWVLDLELSIQSILPSKTKD